MARLQVSEDDFRDAIAEIRHLSPKPGNLYAEGGTDTTPYIIPDFILDYQDGRFSSRSTRTTFPRCASTAAIWR